MGQPSTGSGIKSVLSSKAARAWLGIFFVALGTGYMGWKWSRTYHAVHAVIETPLEEDEHAELPRKDEKHYSKGLWVSYRDLFKNIHTKVQDIERLESDNESLKLENAVLRQKVEAFRFSCEAKNGEQATSKRGIQLSVETGERMGRTLASIRYSPPESVTPEGLYTLAISYFKAGDFEKSAVLFTYLTGSGETHAYQSIKHFLLTGIAWYQVDHLKDAEHYLDAALKMSVDKHESQYQVQALVWKALISERRDDPSKTQFLLNQLVARYPHSPEVEWVNSASERAPASHSAHENPEVDEESSEVTKEDAHEATHGGHHEDAAPSE